MTKTQVLSQPDNTIFLPPLALRRTNKVAGRTQSPKPVGLNIKTPIKQHELNRFSTFESTNKEETL